MTKQVEGPWTKAEIRRLKWLLEQPGSLRSKVGKIRGRSYQAMKEQRIKLGFGKRQVSDLIRELMADGEIRSSREIAEALGRGHQIVNYALRRAVEEGPRQAMHIVDFLGGARARRYVAGSGKNAVDSSTPSLRCFSTREELKEDNKYRASDKWWPKADPDVIAAMTAMMVVGRSQA